VKGVADTLLETRSPVLPQLLDDCVVGTSPVGTPDGLCGGEVRASVESQTMDWWARCRTCKTSALVDWWFGRSH
jgi:hypothetical protein